MNATHSRHTQIQLFYAHLTALFTAISANVPLSLLFGGGFIFTSICKQPGKMHDFIYALISLIDLSVVLYLHTKFVSGFGVKMSGYSTCVGNQLDSTL